MVGWVMGPGGRGPFKGRSVTSVERYRVKPLGLASTLQGLDGFINPSETKKPCYATLSYVNNESRMYVCYVLIGIF